MQNYSQSSATGHYHNYSDINQYGKINKLGLNTEFTADTNREHNTTRRTV